MTEEGTDWREKRLSWDESFMAHAMVAGAHSSCLKRHTGAAIVKNKRMIASGYNGRAPGFARNCLEEGCEKKPGQNTLSCTGSHAETNALLQPTSESKKGAILYTVLSPCYQCAKQIASAEINEVVYLNQYAEEFEVVNNYLQRVGVRLRQVERTEKLRALEELLFS